MQELNFSEEEINRLEIFNKGGYEGKILVYNKDLVIKRFEPYLKGFIDFDLKNIFSKIFPRDEDEFKDIKNFTVRKNSKGEITDIAHYYSHEHVGAYKSLFFEYETPSILISHSP